MSWTFLRAAARNPIAVGSIWPSSPALARELVGACGLVAGDRVVELGAGTGPMTRLLAAHEGPVLALEPDPELAAVARRAAPGVRVVEARAESLPELLARQGWPRVERVVSGLPFAVWPPERQDAVLDALDAVLAPGGTWTTFTYAHSPYLPAGRRLRRVLEDRYQLTVRPIVWACLPPSRVYVLQDRRSPRGLRSRTPG